MESWSRTGGRAAYRLTVYWVRTEKIAGNVQRINSNPDRLHNR
jgi:hypothetical protein